MQTRHPMPSANPDAAPANKTGRRSSRRSAHHTLLFGITKSAKNRRMLWIVAGVIAAVIAIGATILLTTDISWSAVTDLWSGMIAWIEGLNPIAVIPLMALLPIGGFPIAVVYLVAGARFGPVVGGLVVAAVTTVHMVGTYLIGRSFLRKPLQRYIERKHKHLPEVPADEHAAVAVIAALVPGLPYFVRNYLLVLAGVRLTILLAVCVPIYVARSYVTILLGDLSGDPSKTGLVVLLSFDVLKVAICALVIWRLRVHHRKFHGHEDHAHEHDDHGHGHDSGPPAQPSASVS